MTARPQDVALLPLPEREQLANPYAHNFGSVSAYGHTDETLTAYARANVTAALASAQAREEELRAEVERLEYRLETAEAYGLQCDADIRSLLSRAERLEEALREARASADAARTGYSGQHASGTFRRMVQKIDAALSTNAATQKGETT